MVSEKLNAEEHKIFSRVMSDYVSYRKVPHRKVDPLNFWSSTTLDIQNRTIFLERLYADDTVSLPVKNAIAYQTFHINVSAQWVYRHAGPRTLGAALRRADLDEHVEDAIQNPNYDIESIQELLIWGKSSAKTKDRFLKGLPDSVLTQEVLTLIINDITTPYYYTEKYDSRIIYDRARKAFGFDESVPDSWIAQALKVPDEKADIDFDF